MRTQLVVIGVGVLMLSLGSIAQGGNPPNPEDFESYGNPDPWAVAVPQQPKRVDTGWEVTEECAAPVGCSGLFDNTAIVEDTGPAGVGDSALFASGDAGGNIGPRYYGAPEITPLTNNQTLKTDFRMTMDLAFAGGPRPRSRFGVSAHLDPGNANCCGPFNFFADTRDGVLVAKIVGGDQATGSTTEDVPWGGLGVDDVRGPNAPWYTMFVNVDYPNDAVRAKITTQDGVTDYGWSAPVPVGGHSGFGLEYGDDADGKLEATHGRFLLNGFTYMDNVGWDAVPEPASLMLLAIGAAALARRRVA